MTLKIYADMMSQPSRAIIIFCKANRIDFEEIKIDLARRQQMSPDFREINPMGKVPAISDGKFKLFESHAILIYLACAFPGVADHWYPADIFKRAKIHSVLDWHHSNLRQGAADVFLSESRQSAIGARRIAFWTFGIYDNALAGYVFNSILAPAFGLQVNPKAAAEAEKVLSSSLSKIESFWLKGSGRFLVGSTQPSIADLSLVCEIMQLELVGEKDRIRILSPHKKVLQWMQDTKNATRPYFEDAHTLLFKLKERFQKQQSLAGESKINAGKIGNSKL